MTLNRHALRPLTRLLLALGALVGMFTLTPAMSAPDKPAAAQPAPHGVWLNHIVQKPDGGHVVGNPDAQVKLVEYMSYTCPHCAHFEAEGAPALRIGMISSGKGSLEVRHLLRDPIDTAVALLTNCVPANRFFVLHEAFLMNQERWLTPAYNAPKDQQKRWFEGPLPTRMRAIANDLKLYDFVESRGLSRTDADRCLTNEALAKRIAAQTADATAKGVDATPSFGINGVLLTGTHDWATLRPQLEARL
jgi:protein-disulfide isomerase